MGRITTGVPGLDEAMGGGLLKGATVLVVGPPGAGKTVLSNQIAFHRVSRGRSALILTTAPGGVTKLVASIEGLAYYQPDAIGGRLEVHSVNALVAEGGLDALLRDAGRYVREQGVELVVLDAVSHLYKMIDDRAAVWRFLSSLGTTLFLLGCTTIVVMSQYGVEQSVEEQGIADAVILMELSADGQCDLRRLRIPKTSGSAHAGGWHAYEVTAAGVALHPRE